MLKRLSIFSFFALFCVNSTQAIPPGEVDPPLYLVHVTRIMSKNCEKVAGHGDEHERGRVEPIKGRITLHHGIGCVVPTEQMSTAFSFMGVSFEVATEGKYSTLPYAYLDTSEAFSNKLYGGTVADTATLGNHVYGPSSCIIIPEGEQEQFLAKNPNYLGRLITYNPETSCVGKEVEAFLQQQRAYVFKPVPSSFNPDLFPVPYGTWTVEVEGTECSPESFKGATGAFLQDAYQGWISRSPLALFERFSGFLNSCEPKESEERRKLIPQPYLDVLSLSLKFFHEQIHPNGQKAPVIQQWIAQFNGKLQEHSVDFLEAEIPNAEGARAHAQSARKQPSIHPDFTQDDILFDQNPWKFFSETLRLPEDSFSGFIHFLESTKSVSESILPEFVTRFAVDVLQRNLGPESFSLKPASSQFYLPYVSHFFEWASSKKSRGIKGKIWDHLITAIKGMPALMPGDRAIPPLPEDVLLSRINDDTSATGELLRLFLRANLRVEEVSPEPWTSRDLVDQYCSYQRMRYDILDSEDAKKIKEQRKASTFLDLIKIQEVQALAKILENIQNVSQLFGPKTSYQGAGPSEWVEELSENVL